MCEKDYSLLRPFDQDVVKFGDALIHISTSRCSTFVCGPDAEDAIVMVDLLGMFYFSHKNQWRQMPLCWVEGKPVYPDSVLYGKNTGEQYLGKGIGKYDNYTWQKPKQKKKGWVNIYPTSVNGWSATTSHAFTSKEEADKQATMNRAACVQIEWEE